MNKLDLIVALKNETGLTKSDTEAIVNLFFNEMASALTNGSYTDCNKKEGVQKDY